MEIIIDEGFKGLIKPLTPEEKFYLEKSIKAEGCREPLIVWRGKGILVDGHNRYEICSRLNISYEVNEKDFDSRLSVEAWICLNQIGRRNSSSFDRDKLKEKMKGVIEMIIKERKNLEVKARENQVVAGKGELSKNSAKAVNVREELAKKTGVSRDTVSKIMGIQDSNPEILDKISLGEISVNAAFNEVKKTEEKVGSKKPKALLKPSRYCKITCLKEYEVLGKEVCVRLGDLEFRDRLKVFMLH